MINLLIIDEEKILRHHGVRWHSLGVDMVQKAGSGEEILAVCASFTPDIVLCPLRVSGSCLKLRAEYPDCRLIFVADYGDSDYPKALLGDAQYLQKPVSAEQLSEAVWKAIEQAAELRLKNYTEEAVRSPEEVQRAVLRRLAYGGDAYPRQEDASASVFSGPMPAYRFCVLRAEQGVYQVNRLQQALLRTLAGLPRLEAESAWAASFLDHRDFCILLGGEKEDIGVRCAFLAALRERVEAASLPGGRWFMSVSRCVENPVQLSASFADIQFSARELFFAGWSSYTDAGHARPVQPLRCSPVLSAGIPAAVSARNREEADRLLEELYSTMALQTDADPAEIRHVYCGLKYRMTAALGKAHTEKETETQCTVFLQLQHAETLETLHALLVRHVHTLLGEENTADVQSAAVQEVLRILRSEFSDKELSVKSLAERVYLTPTYLSSLFRKYTGKTIGQVLTELRMEYALKLLADKQLRLYHVAMMAGYDDPNYFAKIFKRHLGMTPSEYREKHGG